MFAHIQYYRQVYLFSLVYILVNAVLIYYEFFYLTALPIILVVITITFLRLDFSYYFIVFCTPLAVPLSEFKKGLPFDLQLPTEPLLALVVLIFVLKLLKDNSLVSQKLTKHPVTIAIFFHIFWMAITTLTSSMPLISVKFLSARIWFIVTFYFLAALVFQKQQNIRRFYWLYLIPLSLVILFSFIRLSHYGFDDDNATQFVMNPFYKDHTAYGAVLTMYLPVIIGLVYFKGYKNSIRLFAFGLLFLIGSAILFSHARAAWLSIVGAFFVFLVLIYKIQTRYIIIFSSIVFIILSGYWAEINRRIEKNQQGSEGNITEHVQSISNISNDPSNLERINRWKSAFRMYKERPFFGWGPGTYMFQYAPFQKPREKTVISTNAGDGGNAHSEYLGPLAESGILGTLSFMLVVLTTLITGVRVYKRTKNPEIKVFAMVALLGLITYYLHGFLNNFLDTDKASAPFWGFTAILVAIDLFHKESSTQSVATVKK